MRYNELIISNIFGDIMLNTQQVAAAHYSGDAKNVLVLAGAGCGKTHVIISRIAHLIKSEVSPSRILLLTFTNRSAKEMKSRLKASIGPAADHVFAGTFHKFCLSVMMQMPTAFEMKGLNIIDRDDQLSSMTIARNKMVDRKNVALDRVIPKAAQLADLYSYARNTCQGIQKYLKKETNLSNDAMSVCESIFSAYQEYKHERGYVDFDDLLANFVNILEKKPTLLKQVASVFDHIAVDEMQDTNPIQFSILRLLTSEKANLFVVGDPAQSIYGFRGAEFEHIHLFSQYFENSITLPLSVNYRSHQEILDASNWLLGKSPLAYSNFLTAARGKGDLKPQIHSFDDDGEEACWIADDILHKLSEGTDLKDIMVLVRTAYSARAIEAALAQRGIKYRFIGGTALTKSAHVKDLFSLLRVALNYSDELAWMRYLVIWPRIGAVTAGKVATAILEAGPDAASAQLGLSIGNHHSLVKGFNNVLAHINSPHDAMIAAIDAMEDVLSENHDRWEYRSEDLKLLAKVAESYGSLREFIDAFTLDPLSNTQIKEQDDEDTMTIITVHSAKGTEAPVCYVAQAQDGMYPHTRSMGSLKDEEEERRILYVALTRAMNELIITRAKSNSSSFFISGSPAKGEAYFLSRIPKELIIEKVHGWSAPSKVGGIGSLVDF